MKPLNQENILIALRNVLDPDLNRDIVSLNFVKNISINGKNLSLDIELTTPACPVKDDLKNKLKIQSKIILMLKIFQLI